MGDDAGKPDAIQHAELETAMDQATKWRQGPSLNVPLKDYAIVFNMLVCLYQIFCFAILEAISFFVFRVISRFLS